MLDQGPPRGPHFTLIKSLKALSPNTVTLRQWGVKTSNNEWGGDTIWPVTVAVYRSYGLWWRSGKTIQHILPPRRPTSVARNNLGAGLTIKITIYWVINFKPGIMILPCPIVLILTTILGSRFVNHILQIKIIRLREFQWCFKSYTSGKCRSQE